MKKWIFGFTTFIIVFFLFHSQYLFAYVGPGTGMSAIGTLLAFILGIFYMFKEKKEELPKE